MSFNDKNRSLEIFKYQDELQQYGRKLLKLNKKASAGFILEISRNIRDGIIKIQGGNIIIKMENINSGSFQENIERTLKYETERLEAEKKALNERKKNAG